MSFPPIQHPVRPRNARPIVVIGAGGIVKDAHLPAYRLAGFEVIAIHDIDLVRARALAGQFSIPHVPATIAEAVAQAPADAVFDLAVPTTALPALLEALPDDSPVLIQAARTRRSPSTSFANAPAQGATNSSPLRGDRLPEVHLARRGSQSRRPFYRSLEALHQHARELPRLEHWSHLAAVIDCFVTATIDTTAPARELLIHAQTEVDTIRA